MAVARCLLPYPDPIRRRRIRKDARALVSWVKWPGNDATELDVAELALLRVLWLQTQVRTSARLRQRDAATLLARTALDTCITGLWCLDNPDVVKKMRKDNAKSLDKMMAYLVGTVVSRELVDQVLAVIGGDEDVRSLPSLRERSKQVAKVSGRPDTNDLYDRFYAPISTLVAHGNGLALLRHVRMGGRPVRRPGRVWMMRSAVHLIDACVALLAHAVAERKEAAAGPYAPYLEAHLSRAMPPITFAGGRDSLRNMRWSTAWAVIRAVRDLRTYIASPSFLTDGHDATQARITQLAGQIFAGFNGEDAEQVVPMLVDELVRALMYYDPTVTASPN